MSDSPILVTGCAGFIGFHLSRCLLRSGHQVHGIDNLNLYYDPQLKEDRLSLLLKEGLSFTRLDLSCRESVRDFFGRNSYRKMIHLAAQAGVRYSKENPHLYTSSNIEGFLSILEACRHTPNFEHLIYASSSSVYGANREIPFSTKDMTDRPVSLYAATKKANELMAHAYSWLYKIPCTGLRFFTVYGPWGRPDMALYLFAKAILENQTVELFNHGEMYRDFTYVDDVVESIARLLGRPPSAVEDRAASQIYNVGNHHPVRLSEFLDIIQNFLGKKAEVLFKPLQAGDVVETYADITALEEAIGFRPKTPLKFGIEQSLAWYVDYRRARGQ